MVVASASNTSATALPLLGEVIHRKPGELSTGSVSDGAGRACLGMETAAVIIGVLAGVVGLLVGLTTLIGRAFRAFDGRVRRVAAEQRRKVP